MKAREVLRLLRVSRQTLYVYAKSGKIKTVRLPNGYFEYDDNDVYRLMGKNVERGNVIYARVSTSKQRGDLQRQIEVLKNFALENAKIITCEYSDIASGMSLDRKAMLQLIGDVVEYKVDTIYVTYRDRLARLSYDFLKVFCAQYGTKIVAINETEDKANLEKELVAELVSMIHSFSMKMYSSRRKKKLEIVAKDLALETEED